MVHLTRQDTHIHYSGSPKGMEIVRQSLSFYKEGAEFSKMFRDGHWDGYVRFWEKGDLFPLGMIDIVQAMLDKKEVKYQVHGLHIPYQPSIPMNDKLYEHQKAALEAWFKYRHGIIEVPTRGGKTFIASEAIRLIQHDFNHPVLFLVESESLFDQAIGDISDYLKIPRESIGYIKEGEIAIESIMVGMAQSIQAIFSAPKRLKAYKPRKGQKNIKSPEQIKADIKQAKWLANQLKQYLKIVGFLIVDECHEFGNNERAELIKKICFCDFRLFLSATPLKSESFFNNLNIKSIGGVLTYTIHEKTLKERGILAQDKVLLINMNHGDNKNITVTENDGYQEFVRQVITHNDRRNNVIVHVSNICRRLALKTLVLFIFKKHGIYIQSITGDVFLNGEDNLKTRKSVTQQFLRRKGDVLLASNIFNKGITLPEVQVLFNAGGGLEQANVRQKKGRVLGVKGEKTKALIIDVIDDYQYFNEHSLSRIQVYEESVGIENIFIFDSDDGDFYRDVQEFIKQWFEL